MIEWNRVTWYSKLGAIILFLGIVPALCFYIGTQYELAQQEVLTPVTPQQSIPIEATSQTSTPSEMIGTYKDPEIDTKLNDCYNAPGNGTTVGSDDCLSAALSSYQVIESAKYNLLEEKIKTNLQLEENISPSYKQYYIDAGNSLLKAENAWNTYRDELCSVESDFWTFGTGSGGAYASCEITLTQKHIQDLIDTGSDF